MRKLVTMRHALSSPDYFGSTDMLGGPSWAAWRVLLLACMGEELTEDERVIFRDLTGRDREPTEPVREFWAIVGRRGGKSRSMGTLAAFLAGCCDHRDVLAPGQRGRLPIIAASKEQADEVLAYVVGAFEHSPALKPLIQNNVDRTLALHSLIDIQVRALSFRNLRGATNVAVIADECAYWRSDESAHPDQEVIAALKPSLATTHGPLIGISSPYARRGVLWKAFVRDYGADGRASRLVAKAATQVLNPTIDQGFLDDAFADDPVAAEAEYNAEFRTDLSAFITEEIVDAAVVRNRAALPPDDGTRYVCFVDAAGGSGGDSFTAAIAHSRPMQGSTARVAVLDVLMEFRPPFSPDTVTGEIAEALKEYGVRTVTGDAYAGEWPRERFRSRGITYEVSAKEKIDQDSGPLYRSEIYKQFLVMMNSGRVELLDNKRMLNQLLTLERRVSVSGRDDISHPRGGHDDLINAAAGAVVFAGAVRPPMVISAAALARAAQPGPHTNPYRNHNVPRTRLY